MEKIILLLLMVSTNVMAEWTKVTDSKDVDMTVYIDLGTIKKKGHKVKMWILTDLKTVQKNSTGIKYLSLLNRNEYDCEEETTRMLDLYQYSGNMKGGDNVFSYSNIKIEPISITPDSIDEVFFKIVCDKK
jgi:hypothetical protein